MVPKDRILPYTSIPQAKRMEQVDMFNDEL